MEERLSRITAIIVLMKFASEKDLDILLGLSNIVSNQAKYTIIKARAQIESANRRIAESNARIERTARVWRAPGTDTRPLQPLVIGGAGQG